MQFNSASILPYVAFNKDAFPNRQGIMLAGPNHSARQRSKLKFSRVNFQAQYPAFVRFAVASSAAIQSHRAQSDLPFGTFHSDGLSLAGSRQPDLADPISL
jgi:hypothetical protein